jgi:hypothetical protein
MRKGVSGVRRIAAILSVSLVTLLVTGTGAGAAVAPKIVNYSSVGTGQVLSLKLQLPDALKTVLGAAGLSNNIEQVVSFSRSIGQVDKAAKIGTGLGQVMDGTLNPLLDSVAKTAVGKTLPRVFATLGDTLQHDSLIELTDPAGLVHVGVMEVNAVSSLKTAADGLKAVVSHSDSSIVGLKVDLGSALKNALGDTLDPVIDQVDGLVNTINDGLTTLLNTNAQLKSVVEGLGIDLQLPQLSDVLSRPLVSVGLIQTSSDTGLKGIARTAAGTTSLANVNILGDSIDNAVVHIDSLTTDTSVAIDGTKGGAVANAVTHIAHLKVLGLEVDLTKDLLKVGNLSVPLPVNDVLAPLQQLLAQTLGLKIDILGSHKSASATHAVAEANTVKISLAPLNGALGVWEVAGPQSMAEISGSTVKEATFDSPLPTTGVPTTAYFLAGPALLGMAVLVRRFALSH